MASLRNYSPSPHSPPLPPFRLRVIPSRAARPSSFPLFRPPFSPVKQRGMILNSHTVLQKFLGDLPRCKFRALGLGLSKSKDLFRRDLFDLSERTFCTSARKNRDPRTTYVLVAGCPEQARVAINGVFDVPV